uniref:NAD-dependant epimerase and dehydratase n=1 Tax=Pelagibacter ubique TaxID=198252 RepID=B1A0Q4_PELUQ|nr:NAD-dependant epimerase and dehydratase [Candidatus Pelagibacter ubique]
MKKKVLILGISSFAGSTFVRHILNKDYLVYGTYFSNKIIFSDIKKKKNLKLFKINLEKDKDGLFNIAKKIKPSLIIDFSSICMVNESWLYPEKYTYVNCISKLSLIRKISLIKNLKKFIYVSTPEVFGNTNQPLKESLQIFNPSTPYATTKLFIENLIHNYQPAKNKKFIIARFSNFYGPRQPSYRLIPKLILSIKKNIRFPIHGDGKSKRNYIYSDDFSEALLKIIKKGVTGKTYHFSSEKLYSVYQIVHEICKQMNVDINTVVRFENDRSGKDYVYKLNSLRTQNELGWKAKVSLKVGISKVIEYMNLNFHKIKNIKLNFKIN